MISRQFTKVYRGLHNTSLEDIDTSDIGPHWSEDKDKAMNWIKGTIDNDSQLAGREGPGVLLEGTVRKKDIQKNPKKLKKIGSFGANSTEKETTVKNRKKVSLTKVSKFDVTPVPNDYNKAELVETQEFSSPIKAKVKRRPKKGKK